MSRMVWMYLGVCGSGSILPLCGAGNLARSRLSGGSFGQRRSFGLEPVADVADGLDVLGGVRVGLDLGAQGGDTTVDAARGHEDRTAPHGVQEMRNSRCGDGSPLV